MSTSRNLEKVPIPTIGRPPGVKNRLVSWKNTAAPAWKPKS
jgi:hypothetical protein